MSVLEWLLILELALLALAGVLWLTAYATSRDDPRDPMWAFSRTFWQTVLHPPTDRDARDEGGDDNGADEIDPDEMAVIPDEELMEVGSGPVGAAPTGAAPAPSPARPSQAPPPTPDRANTIRNAQLGVSVSFNCELDRVLGRDSDGLLVEVTAAAEDTAANRSVIQLVSATLGVKAYQVTLTRGHFLAKKGVAITGMSQDELKERLERVIG